MIVLAALGFGCFRTTPSESDTTSTQDSDSPAVAETDTVPPRVPDHIVAHPWCFIGWDGCDPVCNSARGQGDPILGFAVCEGTPAPAAAFCDERGTSPFVCDWSDDPPASDVFVDPGCVILQPCDVWCIAATDYDAWFAENPYAEDSADCDSIAPYPGDCSMHSDGTCAWVEPAP